MFLEMARHPLIQDKVFEEIQRLGHQHLSSESLAQFTFLDSVIKEAMRLHPVVDVVERTSVVPTHILGHDLPANVTCTLTTSLVFFWAFEEFISILSIGQSQTRSNQSVGKLQ